MKIRRTFLPDEMGRTMRCAIALATFACAAILSGDQAAAIILTVASPVDLTPAPTGSGDANRRGAQWQALANGAGGAAGNSLGDSVSGGARYVFHVSADNTNNSGADTATLNPQYQVSFSVNAPAYVTYSIEIDTNILGGLTHVNDQGPVLSIPTNGAASTVSISNVTGGIAGGPLGVGSLNLASATNSNLNPGPAQGAALQTNVSASSSYLISGLVGGNAYTLTFNWSSTATSPNSGLLGTDQDEGSARFGLSNTIAGFTGMTADDYAGPAGVERTQLNDGHFVNITATVTAVPEPSTFALAGAGLIAGGFAAWRRRKR